MYLSIVFLCVLHLMNAAPIEKVMVDMTYVYDDTVQNFPLWKKFEMEVVVNGTFHDVDWLQGEEITTATHMGTHMDSASHFVPGGINIDQIPVSQFMGPAAVIDITGKAAEDPDAVVTVDDLTNWETTTGQSLDGTIVLIKSGWGKKWHNREEFLGTAEEDVSKLHSPGVSREASQWLADNRNIIGVGVETISLDTGNSADFPAHHILLGKGFYVLENVANMDKIPMYGAKLYVMPMKIGRASGSPTRVIATYTKIIFHA